MRLECPELSIIFPSKQILWKNLLALWRVLCKSINVIPWSFGTLFFLNGPRSIPPHGSDTLQQPRPKRLFATFA